MWNPEENDNIEDAAISARSLNELLDLMYISFKNAPSPDCETSGSCPQYLIRYFCLDGRRGETP